MATVERTGVLVKSEARAVNIATPAEGPILRHGAARDVDVNVGFFEGGGIDPELLRAAAHEAERRLHGFLHHIADLAR
jgi:hypothetical protein